MLVSVLLHFEAADINSRPLMLYLSLFLSYYKSFAVLKIFALLVNKQLIIHVIFSRSLAEFNYTAFVKTLWRIYPQSSALRRTLAKKEKAEATKSKNV